MENFRFKGNKLLWNNYSLDIIAKKNKTPFYLYSYNQLKTNVSNFKKTFNKTNPLICFSLKSNSNQKIIKEYAELGIGADVVSIGELKLALKSNIKLEQLAFKIKEVSDLGRAEFRIIAGKSGYEQKIAD